MRPHVKTLLGLAVVLILAAGLVFAASQIFSSEPAPKTKQSSQINSDQKKDEPAKTSDADKSDAAKDSPESQPARPAHQQTTSDATPSNNTPENLASTGPAESMWMLVAVTVGIATFSHAYRNRVTRLYKNFSQTLKDNIQ